MLKLAMRAGLAALFLMLTAAAPARAAAPGGLVQLPKPLGCLSNGGVLGCTSIHDGNRQFEVIVSPDGRNAYGASYAGEHVLIFDRNPATGALKQKSGQAGCVKNGAATATCASARFLDAPQGLAITPDGKTLYVASQEGNAILVFNRNTTTGTIAQKAEDAGCIADNNVQCRDARTLAAPYNIALSPNGKNLYSVAFGTSAVTALTVAADGTLSQTADGATSFGCVANTPTVDCLGDAPALSGPYYVRVSRDGRNVLVGTFGDHSVVSLTRDLTNGRLTPIAAPGGCVDAEATDSCTAVADIGSVRSLTTGLASNRVYVSSESNRIVVLDRAANGTITRHPGATGCVSSVAAANCTTGRSIGSGVVVLSPGGEHLYAAGGFSGGGGVTEHRILGDGGIAQTPGTPGCVAPAALAGCSTAFGMSQPYDAAISPDGRFLYTGDVGGLEGNYQVFRRDSSGPACSTATYTVTAGTVTALKFPCSDVDGSAFTTTIIAPPTLGGLGAIDQAARTVLYAAPQNTTGSTSFTFRSGYSGFLSGIGTITVNVQNPAQPTKRRRIRVGLSYLFDAYSDRTVLRRLIVRGVPRRSRVRAVCAYKGRKCAGKAGKAFLKKRARGSVSLANRFVGIDLPVGAKITVRVTKPGWIGGVKILTMRPRKAPKVTTRCTEPGKSKLKRRCG